MNSAQDLIGSTFQGKYVITDVLGEGAMGIVYRGFDDTSLQEVAIKVLLPSLAKHDELVTRFQREASAARRVGCESAVRVIDRGCEQGLHYLVMELLHGQSLGAVLTESRRLPEGRAARIVVQLAGTLSIAHQRGVVHRDIKPDNIMMVDGGQLGERVKLLDFGIAKRVAAADARVEDSFNTGEETRHGALIGTPEYMAPEQCMGRDVDPRTDIYACGVLLYRMLTGQVPFDGTHPFELCQRHIGEDPRPPRELAPWISPAMEAIILKALSKAPDARHQSAAELRDELAAVLKTIEAVEVEPTARLPLDSLIDVGQLDELSVDLAATVGLPAPQVPVSLDESEDAAATLVLESAPESDRFTFHPLPLPLPVQEVVVAPVIILGDRSTPLPTTVRRPSAARSRLQTYLPTVALAALIGAGLGSLVMALAPLVQR